MSAIAIITARGGSKRIPRKNIREFCGKPIIAYSIEAALESELFDEVMVSTDDEEIADIARDYGASVPFMRSADTSDDYADTTDVLVEVLDRLAQIGRRYDEFCCVYPTAPFVTAQKLIASHALLSQEGVRNVVPVTAFSFPPQRGFVIEQGYIEPIDAKAMAMRSQDLSVVYHDCGQFYWCDAKAFAENHNFLTNGTAPFVVPETEVQDIDTESDWELAELKYELLRRRDVRDL